MSVPHDNPNFAAAAAHDIPAGVASQPDPAGTTETATDTDGFGGVSSLNSPGAPQGASGLSGTEAPSGRRPSLTERVVWRPNGGKTEPALPIHVRLVFADAAGTVPRAIYLTPSRSAGKHGSGLHARCEAAGMLLSWSLRGGMTLDAMADGLKPSVLEGPEGAELLELFAVRAAIRLRDAALADATGAGR